MMNSLKSGEIPCYCGIRIIDKYDKEYVLRLKLVVGSLKNGWKKELEEWREELYNNILKQLGIEVSNNG